MNKRIDKLIEQAKKETPRGLEPEKWLEVYHQNFAQLIVHECVHLFGVTRTEPSLEKFILDRLGVEE